MEIRFSFSLYGESAVLRMTDDRPSVLRVAPLASALGRYGGPYDTALAQATLVAAKSDFRVTLLAPHLVNDAVAESTVDPRVRLVSPRVRRLLPFGEFHWVGSYRALRVTWRLMRQADVAHVAISRELFPLVAGFIALGTSTKLILQPHGMLTARTSVAHRLIDVVVRVLFRRAVDVVALTELERAELEDWSGRRRPPIRVVGNPVRVDADLAALARRSRAREALFLARLHPRKRVRDFVDAAAHAQEQGWDSGDYVVVGPDQGDLAYVSEATSSVAGLRYEGALPGSEVIDRLADSRVFVLPSRNEPWGNVLVAAISLGIPAVITESAALAPMLLEAGVARVIPDESPVALARAVRELQSLDEDAFAELSRRCREFARTHFGNDAIAEALTECYRSAVVGVRGSLMSHGN